MKISYNWLKEFVDVEMDAETLAERLSLVGFEVDEVKTQSLDISGVVIGKVLSREKHPNADKLSLCSVDVADGESLSIICGAPNVAAGQTVIVAKIGATLPIGLTIRKAKIRDVASHGMICSQEELGLAEKSDGIWVQNDNLEAGTPLAKALNYETDYILDIGVTPNRPDGLNHIGIAREVAAICGKKLHIPTPKFHESTEKTAENISVRIDCPETCPRYAARLIRNVTLGPSPEWMQRRLEAVGMRPINNVVDITNYVMLETGQPLHAFDYDLVAGGQIIVRESQTGEKFVTLDDKSHNMQAGTVLICDAEKPVALGGIMGGLNSEVNAQTSNILLEAAYFHPENIQRSLRYLGMNSEASMRFERGVDPNGTLHALSRATELLIAYAGGKAATGAVDEYPNPVPPATIELDVHKINRLLGTSLDADLMTQLLEKIEITKNGNQVIAPTFRPDLERVADIAEEVARLYGYENIEEVASTPVAYRRLSNPFDDFVDFVKDMLTGTGLQEVVTNSLINSEEYSKLTGDPIYTVLNPLNADLDGLRNNLIPGLLNVVRYNLYRQRRDMAIFEISRVFHHPGSLEERAREEVHLAIILSGKREGDNWLASSDEYNFYDIKGFVEFLGDKISLDNFAFIPYDNPLVETQSVKITLGNREVGFLGKLGKSIQKYYDIESPVFVAQLNLESLFESYGKTFQYQDLPRYPFVERDLALILANDIQTGDVLQTIQKSGGKLLIDTSVFDVYAGKQIESGLKSVAFRLIFQSNEKTLTEQEVNTAFDKILNAVTKSHDAKLRT